MGITTKQTPHSEFNSMLWVDVPIGTVISTSNPREPQPPSGRFVIMKVASNDQLDESLVGLNINTGLMTEIYTDCVVWMLQLENLVWSYQLQEK